MSGECTIIVKVSLEEYKALTEYGEQDPRKLSVNDVVGEIINVFLDELKVDEPAIKLEEHIEKSIEEIEAEEE